MILKNRYRIFSIDIMDLKWCKKKGTYCPKDEFGWFCDECNR